MRQFLIAFMSFTLLASSFAFACTRVVWKNDRATIVARTMDWYDNDMRENVFVFPRGQERDGLADENSMSWTSKYGSMASLASDTMAVDGINEKGLGVHTLWLYETDYGKRDPKRPAVSVIMWAQFYLDNFSSVDEAVRFATTSNMQIEPFGITYPLAIHLVIDDASGDSAMIEYINGKKSIYHSRDYYVMANSPSYPQHLTYIKGFKGFGGDKPLPGTDLSLDRFVRASFYTKHLPQPNNDQEMVTEILSVLNNVSMPYGIPDKERPVVSITPWDAVADLTHLVYYHLNTRNMHLAWANLTKFNLNENAPTMKLNLVEHPEYIGDVTDKFLPLDEGVAMSARSISLSLAPSSHAATNQ